MKLVIGKYVALAGCLLIGLGGCSADPKYVEADFGNSVRQMVAAQIYDPVVASDPVEEPPELLDGTGASESVTGYRQSARRSSARNQSSTDGASIGLDQQ